MYTVAIADSISNGRQENSYQELCRKDVRMTKFSQHTILFKKNFQLKKSTYDLSLKTSCLDFFIFYFKDGSIEIRKSKRLV